jgi:hypothetical protein
MPVADREHPALIGLDRGIEVRRSRLVGHARLLM